MPNNITNPLIQAVEKEKTIFNQAMNKAAAYGNVWQQKMRIAPTEPLSTFRSRLTTAYNDRLKMADDLRLATDSANKLERLFNATINLAYRHKMGYDLDSDTVVDEELFYKSITDSASTSFNTALDVSRRFEAKISERHDQVRAMQERFDALNNQYDTAITNIVTNDQTG